MSVPLEQQETKTKMGADMNSQVQERTRVTVKARVTFKLRFRAPDCLNKEDRHVSFSPISVAGLA